MVSVNRGSAGVGQADCRGENRKPRKIVGLTQCVGNALERYDAPRVWVSDSHNENLLSEKTDLKFRKLKMTNPRGTKFWVVSVVWIFLSGGNKGQKSYCQLKILESLSGVWDRGGGGGSKNIFGRIRIFHTTDGFCLIWILGVPKRIIYPLVVNSITDPPPPAGGGVSSHRLQPKRLLDVKKGRWL